MVMKRRKQPQKTLVNGGLRDINDLHSCIEQDYKQLEKQYQKALGSVKKNMTAAKKSFEKARKQAVKARRDKIASKTKAALLDVSAIKKQIAALKKEHKEIKTGQVRFNARQKALMKFDKAWDNKIAKTKKKAGKKQKVTSRKIMPEVSQMIVGA